MKLLMISTDPTLLNEHSAVAMRTRAYGERCESLTVVLAGRGPERKLSLSPNTHVWHPGGMTKLGNFVRMVYAARTIEADVVTAQDPFFAGLVGVLTRKPLQVQLHTDHFGLVGFVLARITLRYATCVRAVSPRVAELLRPLTKAPISLLPVYVDVQRPAAAHPRPPEFGAHPVVLMATRLAPEKRIELVLRAMTHVPAAHLYIAGEGPLKNGLQVLATRLQLRDRVHFLGWQNDLGPYYQHADCFVQASKFEGYGLALLEAALAGCPAVSTNVGIAADLPPESVTMVDGDEYKLASAIKVSIIPERRKEAERGAVGLRATFPSFDEYVTRYITLLGTCTV